MNYMLVAVANLVLCAGVAAVCLRRLNLMSSSTRRVFRLNYSVLFVAAVSSGLQPILWSEWAGYSDLLMNGAVLLFLASGRSAWAERSPAYTTRPGCLDEEDLRHVAGGKR